MNRYDREQRQITEAVGHVPTVFGLRAFPGKRFRLAPVWAHFVVDGDVQLVVQAEMTDDEQQQHGVQPWADFGRNTLAHVLRELVTLPPSTAPLVRIPTVFFDDHADRALPTPEPVKTTKRHYFLSVDDPHIGELLNDAEFYGHRDGPDQCSRGLIASARTTAKLLRAAGVK